MAYTKAAAAFRRCTGTRTDGEPCGAYAVWGDPGQRCSAHGGRRRPGSRPPVCRCVAYNWPHRPGGGLCRWPDEPHFRLTTPAGTHGDGRNWRRRRGGLAALLRRLDRHAGR